MYESYEMNGYFDSYIDRRGCGDELYLDARFRSRALLSELDSLETLTESDFDDEQFDDVANH